MEKKNKKMYETRPFNFGAIHEQDFKKSKFVIIPTPYEATASFGKGQSDGPYAIISSSRFLDELFDSYDKKKLTGLNSTDIFTLDEIEVSKNSPTEAVAGIEQAVADEVLRHNKFPLMLGGEHLVTLGAVKAVANKHKNLSVLQLDAHTDLLNYYESTKYSHACVMRRIVDLQIPITQVGIRNINNEAEEFIKKNKINTFYAPEIPLDKIIDTLTDNVYLTVDLDVFDPSIIPSVGTPEPGGLGWYEVINLIKEVAKNKKIVGADVVELAPIPGFHGPDFLAAKLVYQIMNLINNSKK